MNLRTLAKQANSGGFSYSLFFGDLSGIRGYAVAIDVTERAYKRLTTKSLAAYVARHRDLLTNPTKFLGGWAHGGRVYLDVSTKFGTLREAKIAGKANNQKAIFNLKTLKTIYL